MKKLRGNPLTHWLRWAWSSAVLERKHEHLRIEYMASCEDCSFGKFNTVLPGAKLTRVSLGDFSYVAHDSLVRDAKIGKFSCIGLQTIIGLGRHPSRDFISIHPVFYSTMGQSNTTFADRDYFQEQLPTIIGNDVWIGARVVIPGGVSIGDGAIIGSGAVVAEDVPPYAIVGGVPARMIRMRFPPEQVQAIQASAWWDEEPESLRPDFRAFHDFEKFSKWVLHRNRHE